MSVFRAPHLHPHNVHLPSLAMLTVITWFVYCKVTVFSPCNEYAVCGRHVGRGKYLLLISIPTQTQQPLEGFA